LSNQSHRVSLARAFLTLAAVGCVVVGFGCAGVKQGSNATGNGGSGAVITGGGGTGFTGSGGSVAPPPTCTVCNDFPTTPIIGVGVPADAPGRFGAPSGAAPCVTEPEDGTLFPNNWLRPRIRVPGNTGVLKITFHADREANDLVAYASGETWALPKDIWMALARNVQMEDVTVTVQAQGAGAATVKFRVAPIGAAGSMVFWSADPSQVGKVGVEKMTQTAVVNDSILKGFTVGDESTVDTLKITDVAQQVGTQDGPTQGSHCIGCHTGTPDGDYVGFVDSWPWAAAFAGVKPDPTTQKTGAAMPGFAGGTCTSWNNCTTPRTFVQYPWAGPMTFSPAHWMAGDKKAVMVTQMKTVTMPWSTDNWQPGRLVWVDLEQSAATTPYNGQINPTEGVAFGYLARTGDPHPAAAFPNWSHSGKTIVYASTVCASPGETNKCGMQDGRLSTGATDLYEVPYNDKAGGTATAVPGASTTAMEEYYPAYSPDDSLIAFTAVPSGQVMYANPSAELYVVKKGATSATKLRANTPPSCSNKSSPGINNHWPKWSPDAVNVSGSTYYWIIFSSNRYGLPPVMTNFNNTPKSVELSQLYITAVVVDELTVTTYPAIYLWNQPQNRLNTTPAWEHFHIPVVID
jgi:hypothetical protein